MLHLILTFFPYGLLMYFAYRFYREPIYLLGVVFLIFFRYCILFESVRVFWVFGRLGQDILLLLWYIFFWAIILIRVNTVRDYPFIKNNERKSYLPTDYFIGGLMLISVLDLVLVTREFYSIENVFTQFFTLFSLFLGYFLIKTLVRLVDAETLKEFLFAIVAVNTLACVLFILHQGLQISIFTGEEYSEEYFEGVLITRTFWFIPILLLFSVAYLFTFFDKQKKALYITMLAINFMAIFISYNRSTLINALLIYFLLTWLKAYKEKQVSTIIKNFMLIGVMGVVFFFAVSTFLPANTKFFMSRFEDLKDSPRDEESNTLVYRFARTSEVFEQMDANKAMFGFGPVTSSQMPWVETMTATTADMAWAGVAFRWGFMGLILVVLTYIVSLFSTYKLFMQSEGLTASLALLFFLVITSQVIEGFTSYTFMARDRYAMGFWYLGIAAALVQGLAHNKSEQEETSEDE